jgi:hypothetical protein
MRWITYAAKEDQGWTPFVGSVALEYGMKIYREAGGTNAVLANCSIDLAERPESAELAKVASVNFICSPEEARRRIKRVEQLSFEEILERGVPVWFPCAGSVRPVAGTTAAVADAVVKLCRASAR